MGPSDEKFCLHPKLTSGPIVLNIKLAVAKDQGPGSTPALKASIRTLLQLS